MPNKDRFCPVCGSIMIVDQSMMDGTLCELHEKCPNKDYFYSYAYGNTEVCVADKEFSITHNAPSCEMKKFNADFNAAIKEARETCPRS